MREGGNRRKTEGSVKRREGKEKGRGRKVTNTLSKSWIRHSTKATSFDAAFLPVATVAFHCIALYFICNYGFVIVLNKISIRGDI